MTCDEFRHDLLNRPDLDGPPDGHAASCDACRAFWEQARELDARLAELPVPDAPKGLREQLVASFVDMPTLLAFRREQQREARARQSLRWLVVGVALLVAFAAVFLTPPAPEPVESPKPMAEKPHTADPFLAALVSNYYLAMREAKTPAERLRVASDTAGRVREQARRLALVADRDSMDALAGWHRRLIRRGVLGQAGRVQARDREVLFDVAAGLIKSAEAAKAAAGRAPVQSADPLRRMAAADRETAAELRRLARVG